MGVGLRVRKTSQLSCRGKGVWLLGVNQSACVRSDVVTLFRSSDWDRLRLCGLGAPSQGRGSRLAFGARGSPALGRRLCPLWFGPGFGRGSAGDLCCRLCQHKKIYVSFKLVASI